MYIDAPDELIQLRGDAFNALVQREASRLSGYDYSKYYWSKDPLDAQCLLCYEWRRYPAGQRHFGFSWWRSCKHECLCQHHKSEVWIG